MFLPLILASLSLQPDWNETVYSTGESTDDWDSNVYSTKDRPSLMDVYSSSTPTMVESAFPQYTYISSRNDDYASPRGGLGKTGAYASYNASHSDSVYTSRPNAAPGSLAVPGAEGYEYAFAANPTCPTS